MGRCKSKSLFLLAFVTFLLVVAAPLPTSAKSEFPGRETTPLDVVMELVFVRPLSFVGTAVCTGFFVVSLPLTIWTEKRFTKVLKILVVKPGKFTFTRPPGEF